MLAAPILALEVAVVGRLEAVVILVDESFAGRGFERVFCELAVDVAAGLMVAVTDDVVDEDVNDVDTEMALRGTRLVVDRLTEEVVDVVEGFVDVTSLLDVTTDVLVLVLLLAPLLTLLVAVVKAAVGPRCDGFAEDTVLVLVVVAVAFLALAVTAALLVVDEATTVSFSSSLLSSSASSSTSF